VLLAGAAEPRCATGDQEDTLGIVAVSAHLDDAALSASVALTCSGATVLTVFSGLPPAEFGVSSWDRLTGARNSADRQRERRAEDAAAMRLLSAEAGYLDEQEALYRSSEPDLDGIAGKMVPFLAGADEVWLPSAIGGHGDHAIARDAGLRAAAMAGHDSVVLYADFPYVIIYGWPSWVSGEQADPYLDAASWLSDAIGAAGLDAAALSPQVIALTEAQRQLKAEVAGAYRSQAPVLRLAPADLAREPVKLGYELYWRMSLAPERP
jgi:hypothetical protein